MILIPFPRSCTQGPNSYNYTVGCYKSALQSSDDVTIECGEVTFFQPMGLTLLAAIMYHLSRDSGRNVYFSPPSNVGVYHYLETQDLFKEFIFEGMIASKVAVSQRSTGIGLKRLESFDGTYIEQIPVWLKRNSHMPPEAISDVINATIPEIINNVFDHSQSPIGCYVTAQAYPVKKTLILSALDLGVGFLRTLQPQYPSLKHDSEAIELAVQQGITAKSKPYNAGAGLDVLSGLLKEYGGSLEIISRDGRWKQDKTSKCTKHTLPFQFPGTCINLEFDDQAMIDRFRSGDRYE